MWQIKTYIDKIGIKKLHNFTFFNDIESEKQKFIEINSEEEYYKLNVLNMFEIMDIRSKNYQKDNYISIPINNLLNDQIDETITLIKKNINIDINLKNVKTLHQRWKELHNPVDQIYNYPWFEKVYTSPRYNAENS